MNPPVALTIAGSRLGRRRRHPGRPQVVRGTGSFGTSAITALTAQNTRRRASACTPVPAAFVLAQVEAVLGRPAGGRGEDRHAGHRRDGPGRRRARRGRPAAEARGGPGDGASSSGDRSARARAAERLYVEALLPHATVPDANLREAQVLLGRTIRPWPTSARRPARSAALGRPVVV
jgi:hydroxymethylpyrimidine/phosphomethylpyrimidine kinase